MVGAFEQAMLAGMLVFIMLGMGASLTPKDFALALRRPHGLGIGLATQYGLMPLIAFALAAALPLTADQAIGLLIMGCMPGGTTSNLFTYFSRGNLALSVLMTVNSTVFGIVLIPLLLFAYAAGFGAEVPMSNVVQSLVVLMVPVGLGMLLRRANANWGALVELAGGMLGIVFIVFLAATWIPRNWHLLAATPWAVYAGAVGLGLAGFLAGYQAAKALRLHPRSRRTISLETGIQNGPLAIAIVLFSFPEARQQAVLLVPALYALFIVITASALTLWFRRVDAASEQKMPDALL